jgi:hypothetical protein
MKTGHPLFICRADFEIQLAPDLPVVKVIPQFHPPTAAVFFF